MARYWCDERNISMLFMVALKRRGYILFLGKPPEFLLTYSRSDLLSAGAKLEHVFLQGRGFVDIAAYNDELGVFVAGVAITRLIPLSISRGVVSESLRLLLSVPNDAQSSFRVLRERGFKFKSMNAAKLYKSVVVCRALARTRDFFKKARRVVLAVILSPAALRDRYVAMEAENLLKRLTSYLSDNELKGSDLHYSIYAFRPSEVSAHSPKSVVLEHLAGEEVIGRGEEVATEGTVDPGAIGCRHCPYLRICAPL